MDAFSQKESVHFLITCKYINVDWALLNHYQGHGQERKAFDVPLYLISPLFQLIL